jgi:hypothetical protein
MWILVMGVEGRSQAWHLTHDPCPFALTLQNTLLLLALGL